MFLLWVTRLQNWCAPRGLANLNLDSNRVYVYWHGEGGATICNPSHPKSILTTTHFIQDLSIDITFIEIGSNDLCDPDLDPVKLVGHVMAFSEQLLRNGCHLIVLSEILHRLNAAGYNQRVDYCNQLLHAYCTNAPCVMFWSHSRQNFNKRFLKDFIAADGVHVDPLRGMSRYYI